MAVQAQCDVQYVLKLTELLHAQRMLTAMGVDAHEIQQGDLDAIKLVHNKAICRVQGLSFRDRLVPSIDPRAMQRCFSKSCWLRACLNTFQPSKSKLL